MAERPHPWARPGRGPPARRSLCARRSGRRRRGDRQAFPRLPALQCDPAIEEARLSGSRASLEDSLAAFRAVIDAGVRAVMLAPPWSNASIHRGRPRSRRRLSTSCAGIWVCGLIISDDLDSRATLGSGQWRKWPSWHCRRGGTAAGRGRRPSWDLAQAIFDAVATGSCPRRRWPRLPVKCVRWQHCQMGGDEAPSCRLGAS